MSNKHKNHIRINFEDFDKNYFNVNKKRLNETIINIYDICTLNEGINEHYSIFKKYISSIIEKTLYDSLYYGKIMINCNYKLWLSQRYISLPLEINDYLILEDYIGYNNPEFFNLKKVLIKIYKNCILIEEQKQYDSIFKNDINRYMTSIIEETLIHITYCEQDTEYLLSILFKLMYKYNNYIKVLWLGIGIGLIKIHFQFFNTLK